MGKCEVSPVSFNFIALYKWLFCTKETGKTYFKNLG